MDTARTQIDRRRVLTGSCVMGLALNLAGPMSRAFAGTPAPRSEALDTNWTKRLLDAARAQIGVTVRYDPTYTRLAFPGGDVARDKGVCTDVVIRAYRDALGIDLQALVNADMRTHFSRYPRNWNLQRPDPSIDHRRVLNLRVFFSRHGAALGEAALKPEAFQPGDIVTLMLPGNLPHIGLVSDKRAPSGHYLVVHNIGSGAEESDVLALYALTGRYRFGPLSNVPART